MANEKSGFSRQIQNLQHLEIQMREDKMKTLFILTIILTLFNSVTDAQISDGGNFTLEQAVIAAGGLNSTGGNFKVEGTIGQAAAGTRSTLLRLICTAVFGMRQRSRRLPPRL